MRTTSLSMFRIVVAGVCLAAIVMTAEALRIDHKKFSHISSNSVVPGHYIITFNSNESDAGALFASSFKKEFKSAGLKVKQQLSHNFFNGISISLDNSDGNSHQAAVKAILDRDDVASVSPITLYSRPTVEIVKKKKGDTPSVLPHAMTQVDLVHSVLKNKGKGILIGVIDTGVDYLHPALGGGFGKGFKVSKGYDLVGNAYTGSNTPVPDSNPLDACGASSGAEGHGTHVSGIIAGYDAKMNFTGVAPEANLGMWRVFGCSGQVTNDVIIKALLMAYDAGCDIINLSLGGTNSWAETSDSLNKVVSDISSEGVTIVVSAGNSGSQGIYTLAQPGTAVGAFAVASIENSYYASSYITATGVNHSIEYTAANASRVIKNGLVVIADKNPGGNSDSCKADQISSKVKGKIALIGRGTCTFSTKVNLAAAAGAIGVIIYDDRSGRLDSIYVPNASVPTVYISQADGKTLLAVIKKGAVRLTFKNNGYLKKVADAGTVSTFSGVGSTAELHFKPNIAGVGGNIYSTLPRYLGSWGVMSGTSMAAPYVAGSIALYKSYNGKKQSTTFVNQQFQNYAKSAFIFGAGNVVDTPLRQGAGLVQVYDSLTEKVHIAPAQISFNDTATDEYKTHSFVVTNSGSKTISYKLVNNVTVALSPYDVEKSGYTPLEPVGDVIASAKLRFSDKKFTLAPGKSKEIHVTVTPPNTYSKDHIFYGGFIQIVPTNHSDGKTLKIPYFGVKGVQKNLPIFDSDSGFPTLVDADGYEQSDNSTFTFDRSNKATVPYVVIRLLTPTAHIQADLISVSSKEVVGQFLTGLNYLERHFTDSGSQYQSFVWDGTYVPASSSNSILPIPAPQDTYQLRLSALKLLGNPKNGDDWDVWTSGYISLKN